jgi:hypothetical protein
MPELNSMLTLPIIVALSTALGVALSLLRRRDSRSEKPSPRRRMVVPALWLD